MPDLAPIRRALLSVSDKTDLVPFARHLRELGVDIISTGGTARALRDAGIDVVPVDQVTGFPEMMDGRVKTLHPSVHGAVLGRRDVASHMEAMAAHGIEPIDLVCINLYPFEQTILRDDVSAEEAIEQIDIGGPALLRSAAKNHDSVTVLTAPDQYDHVVTEMRANDGATTRALRRDLAAAAFMRTAGYDTAISAWMCSRRERSFPSLLRLTYAHELDLRYGENPHQPAAAYRDPSDAGASVLTARLLNGKPLSYNNLNDGAQALTLAQDLARTAPDDAYCAIIKHTNPCGVAARPTLGDAWDAALAGDPIAAYGGILATSRTVDADTAERIAGGDGFLEVIIAPGFGDDARQRLAARWKNVRLLETPGFDRPRPAGIQYRSIPGGILAQQRDAKLAETDDWVHAAGPEPDDALLAEAAFAWIVVKHLTSNAVAITTGRQLVGAGAGQVDRVGACRIAVEKAGDRLPGSGTVIGASDAFFPFDDGPRVLLDAGVTCLVHTGGSKRDSETIALCEERGVTCLLTGVRHFRH
ncbi:MAG: bifunctional phosphoribosylaminoimidazolecarboxamide formyltransferase/IMP cyclohydrolase [Planctomycetes bacterium]|nr:bifunctional phosphoribosylaminoimidazolecarboxamide formyltransferase/IMP cyclohydrolase [Planctomycetota bacterium]